MMERKRRLFLGSWIAPASSVSANAIIDVSGVRNSCDTDRKSTRLNSSHSQISYAVFCLKKKKRTRLKYTVELIRTLEPPDAFLSLCMIPETLLGSHSITPLLVRLSLLLALAERYFARSL